MGQFSDDGQWWWDRTQWVATSQVVLPDLPMTEFERSGKLEEAPSALRKSLWWGAANSIAPLAAPTGVALLALQQRALQVYRLWTLEQLALATAYLLGPNEAMLAGEPTMLGPIQRYVSMLQKAYDEHKFESVPPSGQSDAEPSVTRDLAVVVTAAHVLVFRIDFLDGQPRWVALAGRATDVKIELRTRAFGFSPALMISSGNGRWAIRGSPRVFKPEPVLEAWRQAATGTVHIG